MFFKRKQLYLIAGAIVLTLFFVSIAFAYNNPAWTRINKTAESVIYNFLGDAWISFFTIITYIGSGYVSFPITAIIVLYLLFRKKYWIAGLLAYNLIGVRQVNWLLKSIFEVTRPGLEHLVYASYFSFPSGHSMNSIAFFGLLAFLLSRYMGRTRNQVIWIWTFASLLIALIGLSRVYLGVHFPLDVLGGFAAGGAWLLISILIHSFLPIMENYRLRGQ